MRNVLIALISLPLASCGIMTHWENYPELSGPQLLGNERSQGVRRCALVRNISGGPCEFGFIDQQKNVIPREKIEQEVENYLTSNNLPVDPLDHIYILTISPTVVMLVPSQSNVNSKVRHMAAQEIHAQSKHLIYGKNPIKSSGAMIFVANTNLPPTHIADNADSLEISLSDSTLKITRIGTIWHVLRSPKPRIQQ